MSHDSNDTNLERLEEQFEKVMSLKGGARKEFLSDLPDSERRHLERLLKVTEKATDYFDRVRGFLPDPRDVDTVYSPGKTVGHFRIEDVLGRGGRAVVYRATDLRLNRTVALKIIRLSEVQNFKHFLREARLVAAINHENICQILISGFTDENTGYIAMPLHNGVSLRECLDEGPVEFDKVFSIVEQSAKGIQAAHDQGIVHRDIKPDNLFLTESGVVKILDFGIARLEAREMSTAAGILKGTIPYMSPEHITNPPAGPATDFWALGVTAYELVTGQKPFYSLSNRQCMNAIVNEPPPGMDKIAEPLRSVINTCLEKDPSNRFGHASELLAQLGG